MYLSTCSGPKASADSREEVRHIVAHNDSTMVAHMPDPQRYTISAAPRENTLLEGIVAILSLTYLFGCALLPVSLFRALSQGGSCAEYLQALMLMGTCVAMHALLHAPDLLCATLLCVSQIREMHCGRMLELAGTTFGAWPPSLHCARCRAVWAGPWLMLAFMYAVVVQRSTTAMLILALILGEALLVPTGKVRAALPLTEVPCGIAAQLCHLYDGAL